MACYLLRIVLKIYFHSMSLTTLDINTTVDPSFPPRKLRHGEVQILIQGHPVTRS